MKQETIFWIPTIILVVASALYFLQELSKKRLLKKYAKFLDSCYLDNRGKKQKYIPLEKQEEFRERYFSLIKEMKFNKNFRLCCLLANYGWAIELTLKKYKEENPDFEEKDLLNIAKNLGLSELGWGLLCSGIDEEYYTHTSDELLMKRIYIASINLSGLDHKTVLWNN